MPNEQGQKPESDRRHVREVVTVLSREYAMEILEDLFVRGRSTASEVARELGIHVATAMRKLAEMEALGLVSRRVRPGTNLDEYALKNPRIELVFDLAAEARARAAEATDGASKTFVR